MFKVHEKFKDREVWVRVQGIMKVYQMENDGCTVIVFRNGEYTHVTESVEDVLMNIHLKENRPRLLDSEV